MPFLDSVQPWLRRTWTDAQRLTGRLWTAAVDDADLGDARLGTASAGPAILLTE